MTTQQEAPVDLDTDTCLQLLASQHLGRVAVNDDDGPAVFPVNYLLDRDSVVFRTDEGTKLDAAVRGERAAFEVDHVDEPNGVGWSVLVRGAVVEVTDPGELDRLRALPLTPFVSGKKDRYVRVRAKSITGRRTAVPHGVPEGWFRPDEPGHVWHGVDGSDIGLC